MNNKNGIRVHSKNSHIKQSEIVGYTKQVNGYQVEIIVDHRNVQSTKLKDEGWKPIYKKKKIKRISRLENWLVASLIANVIMLWLIVNKLFFY